MYLFGSFLSGKLLKALHKQVGLFLGDSNSSGGKELSLFEEIGNVTNGARLFDFFTVLLLYDQSFVIINIFFNLLVVLSEMATDRFIRVFDL